jgi:hypothetical protein
MHAHRRLVVGATVAALAALAAAPAYASTSTTTTATITAVVGGTGLTGTRTLTAFPAVALSGTTALGGTLTAGVTETAATGDVNGWSVTVQSSALDETAPATSGVIPASDLSIGSIVAPSATGCLSVSLGTCAISGGSGGALDSPQTLFAVTGESASYAYTGVYTATGVLALSVPNGTAAGDYSGTLTATLIQ